MSSDVLMVRKKSFISLLFNWIDFTVASRRSTGVPVKRFFFSFIIIIIIALHS